jgi:hypothetical protein
MRYATRRAPGANTARLQFGYLGKPFALFNDAIDVPVPREHQQDALTVPGIDLGRRAVRMGMDVVGMSLEIEQATLAQTPGNYPATNKVTLAGGTKWSTATGTPMADVDLAREAIRQQCGRYPNVMVAGPAAFNACKNNASVVDRFKYNGAAGTDSSQITAEMLAGLFNVKKVVVGAAIYFTDAGVATDIWGNAVVLAYVPEDRSTDGTGLSLEMPSYGYTYTLDGNPMIEAPYWDPPAKSWIYGAVYERAPVLSGITAGYLITNPA